MSNCYPLTYHGIERRFRHDLVYKSMQPVLCRMPFVVISALARLKAIILLFSVLGVLLEKSGFCSQDNEAIIDKESAWSLLKGRLKNTCVNNFDCFGVDSYQHFKSDADICGPVSSTRANLAKVSNMNKDSSRLAPIGFALRAWR